MLWHSPSSADYKGWSIKDFSPVPWNTSLVVSPWNADLQLSLPISSLWRSQPLYLCSACSWSASPVNYYYRWQWMVKFSGLGHFLRIRFRSYLSSPCFSGSGTGGIRTIRLRKTRRTRLSSGAAGGLSCSGWRGLRVYFLWRRDCMHCFCHSWQTMVWLACWFSALASLLTFWLDSHAFRAVPISHESSH